MSVDLSSLNPVPNHFHARVKGRVQGVGYRLFAREAARKQGITGWVRNLPDRSVEIYAEGSEEALTEFLTDLHRGPVMAHVAEIDLSWSEKAPEHSSFEIVR